VQHPLRVGAPALEPTHAEVARTRDGEEGQQRRGGCQARGEVEGRRLLLGIRGLGRVLAVVRGERDLRSFALLGGNLEREAAAAARDRGVQPFR